MGRIVRLDPLSDLIPAVRAVPSDLVEQQRADALAANVRPQIEVFEHVTLKGGIAEDLRIAHCHPHPACLEQDVPNPPGDLVVTSLLRGQVRHRRHPRSHVDACDHRRVCRVSEPDLCHANITHGRGTYETSRDTANG